MTRKLIHAGKRFEWGDTDKLTMNIGANWLDAIPSPITPRKSYSRITGTFRMNKIWEEGRKYRYSLGGNLEYIRSYDDQKSDKDLDESTGTLAVNRRTRLFREAVNEIGSFAYNNSPAASLFRHKTSLTSAEIRFDRRNENSVALADVEYNNGRKKNVQWNTTADMAIVYPYIVADSIGGDLNIEQYRFRGGYAHKIDRFHFGVYGSYRALYEYARQTLDPVIRRRIWKRRAWTTSGR